MGLAFSFIICVMAVVIASTGRKKARQVKVRRLVFPDDLPYEEETAGTMPAADIVGTPAAAPAVSVAAASSGKAEDNAPRTEQEDRQEGVSRLSLEGEELKKMIVYSEILKPKFDE